MQLETCLLAESSPRRVGECVLIFSATCATKVVTHISMQIPFGMLRVGFWPNEFITTQSCQRVLLRTKLSGEIFLGRGLLQNIMRPYIQLIILRQILHTRGWVLYFEGLYIVQRKRPQRSEYEENEGTEERCAFPLCPSRRKSLVPPHGLGLG